MAWIESHQELGAHPKVRKMAIRLDVHRMQVVGHLHALWWWALDYADDGDLAHFTDEDVALGAEWDGDPAEFVAALRDCGPGGRSGFVDPDGSLHDWHEYAGKLVERRRADAERKAAGRRKPVQETPVGESEGSPEDTPKPVRRTSSGRDAERRKGGVRTQPNPTREPNGSRQPKRPPKGAGPRELAFHAVLEDLFGIPADTDQGLRRKVVRSLMGAEAEPADLEVRAALWRDLFPPSPGRKGATLTPTALEKWWGQLGLVAESRPAEFDPETCVHPPDRRAVIGGDEFCAMCRKEL